MKKSIAIILCLVMALSVLLTGCGSDADKLVGTWKATIDMSSYLNDTIAEADAEIAEYFSFEDLTFDVIMTFGENGECAMEADEDSWSDMAEKLGEQMKVSYEAYFKDLLKSMGVDMTVDELLSASGTTMDDMIDEMLDEMMSSDVLSEMESEGYFKLQDGMIYISEEKDDAFDEDVANPYTLDGDNLTIKASEDEEDEDYIDFLYPLELKKVK